MCFENICQFATDCQRKQSSKKDLSKMRHFTINLVVNIIGAILFLVMGIALIVGFVLNQSIVEELQQVTLLVLIMFVIDILLLLPPHLSHPLDDIMQAANFDNWNPFILCAGILALFTAGVFILGSWKVIVNMMMAVVVLPLEKVDLNHILFQEATFASGDKNKAVRYLKFLETIWFVIRILMHTETNINFMLISKVTTVSKVRETIYILGLGVPGLRPPTDGEETPVLKVPLRDHLSHDIL